MILSPYLPRRYWIQKQLVALMFIHSQLVSNFELLQASGSGQCVQDIAWPRAGTVKTYNEVLEKGTVVLDTSNVDKAGVGSRPFDDSLHPS